MRLLGKLSAAGAGVALVLAGAAPAAADPLGDLWDSLNLPGPAPVIELPEIPVPPNGSEGLLPPAPQAPPAPPAPSAPQPPVATPQTNQVIGEFTTSGFAADSGVNIRRVAEQVNGAVVAPGAVFSLNGYTGPRGTAQGYIEAGVISNGRPGKAIGGGISQFATTLFNASYFAGMQDVEHHEHSYYISRYPAGREATVWQGVLDVKFRNTSPNSVRIEAFANASSVTVRIIGTKTVNVESVNGGRWNYTQPGTITLAAGPNCIPTNGSPGFTTSDTRIIRNAGTGAEISRNTRTVVYDPLPTVYCR
ncbi:VanW family protein [Hoyosella sp. G463]|uniref:VanW family protein n=1 Tax=Lolliginicoccus lacisalsi TaxID=2742202 RepID=A0A927JCB9_9ACTN|nr:VanW family protein [Lolliginicoccus lacisalsi]